MAKVTENLLTKIKKIGDRKILISDLATELNVSTNSVLSTMSYKEYTKYFIKTSELVNDKKVSYVSLSQKGLDLLTNNEQESK